MKTAAVICMTLALGIGAVAKPHPHHEDSLQGKVGAPSETDRWRHYLLQLAWDMSSPTDDPRIITARKFRAEFEKAIDDFNAAQERQTEAEQIASLKTFITWRDAIVQSYRYELLSMVDRPELQTALEMEVLGKSKYQLVVHFIKSSVVNSATGEDCGPPNSLTCSITYSLGMKSRGNPDRTISMVFNQIVDGVATMAGNPEHARHTPAVTLNFDDEEHNNSGKSVCADCYLYVNGGPGFPMKVSEIHKFGGEGGVVVCSEAGKIFDVGPGKE